MARVARLLGPARRLCAERGRRDTRGQPAAAVLVVLEVVLSVRHLANAYLAGLVGPRLAPEAGARYLVGSAWLLLLWFCTSGCARAVRTTSVLLTHERFRAAPVRRPALVAALAHAALLRPAVAALAALWGVSLAAALSVWGPKVVPARELGLLAVAGLAAHVLTYAALAFWRAGDRTLGYLELLFVVVVTSLNPDVRVADGGIALALANGGAWAPTVLRPACLALGAIPAAFALAAAAARGARLVAGRLRRAQRPLRRPHDPLLALYRADLPLGIFTVAFVAEGALAVAGTLPAASLGTLAGMLLLLRLGWYALFALRTEYRLADWRPAPLLGPRERLALYTRTVPAHLAVCLSPGLFYLVRAARA